MSFPPTKPSACGFFPDFSTTCGKPCGKKKFYTGLYDRFCVKFQNSPDINKNRRGRVRKPGGARVGKCGKSIHRLVDNRKEPLFSTRGGGQVLKVFHRFRDEISPQRQDPRRDAPKQPEKWRFFANNGGFTHFIHRNPLRYPQKFAALKIESALSRLINSVFNSFNGPYCYYFWSCHVFSCILCILSRAKERSRHDASDDTTEGSWIN